MTSQQIPPQDLATAAARAMWDADNASPALGMALMTVTPGTATLTMTVRRDMTNGHGTCHGGFIFTLADSAFAFACNSYNQRTVAQMASVSFLAPALEGEVLTAHATELWRQGRGGVYDVRVTRADGTVIAEFRGHSRTVKGTHVPMEE